MSVRVTIVEDEAAISLDLQSRLEGLGYSPVARVASGEELLAGIAEDPPDLVLMDIVLKGDMDGFEAAEIVRSRWGIPVVFVTAYAEEEHLSRAKALRPAGYLVKPVDDLDLRAAIELALGRKETDAKRLAIEKALAKRSRDLDDANRELQRNLVWLKGIISALEEAVFVVTADRRVLNVNLAAERMFGYSADELDELSTEVLHVDHDHYVEFGQRIQAAFERNEAARFEFQAKRKSGEVFPTEHSVSLLEDDAGATVGIVSVVRDLSERRRSEDLAATRLRLYEFAESHSLGELLTEALNEAERLTHSRVGFFHFVEADQRTLSFGAWSTRTTTELCTAEGQGAHYTVDEAGVWVDCLRQRRPVVHNDYASLPHKKGLPEGHAAVVRELVVPILREDLFVGIIGVGNKASDYSHDDVEVVKDLANAMWEIAARKRAEEMQKEAAHRLSLALRSGRLGVWDWKVQGNAMFWDDEMLRMYGITRAEFSGRVEDWERGLHPEDRERAVAECEAALAGDEDFDTEFRLLLSDGRVKHIKADGLVLRDEEGTPTRMIGVNRDITDLKDVHKQVERQALLLEEGQKIGAFGSWDWNFRTGEIWWSEGLYAIYGVDPAAGPPPQEGDRWVKTIHPDDREMLLEKLRRVRVEGRDYDAEYRIIRQSDRKPRWIHAKARVLRDETGQPERLVGVGHDVTERKEAEEALRKSESLLDRTGHMARVGGWELDARTMEVSWTRETYEIHEVPFGKMPSLEEALSFWHPEDRPVLQRAIECALASGEPYDLQLRFITAHGRELHARTMCRPVFENGEVVRLEGTFQDISERLRAEAERRSLEQQLHQSQKMESIGRLAGGVAHDFNNMLGAIMGHLDLALEEMDASDPLREHLSQALVAAERSADLTNQLLAFARKQTVSPQVLDLDAAIASMLSMLRRLIGEHIDLRFVPDSNGWSVRMDPSQLHQIVVNLCVNSRDAIEGHGIIEIRTGCATLQEEDWAWHGEMAPGQHVVLELRDSGCGIDEETQLRVFEPFFTTKEAGRGTGLGLATVYGIVKQNRGHIQLESSPGHGASFRIFLPRHLGATEPASDAPLSAHVRTGAASILLVEDESIMLDLGTTMLQRLGYQVIAARTPMEAINLAQDHAGEIDLLMTDVIMPEMDGRQLAGKIQGLYPEIRCLFMSGYTADVIAHRGVLDRDVNFIQKPFKLTELAAKVERALG